MSKPAPFKILTRRPLVGVSFAFASGCGLVSRCDVDLLLLLFILPALLLISAIFRRHFSGLISLYVAVVCAGALHGGLYRAAWLDVPSVRAAVSGKVQGVIRGDPSFFDKNGQLQTAVVVAGTFLELNGMAVQARMRVVCSGHVTNEFRHGEQWQFSGRFYPYRHRGRYAGVLYVKNAETDALFLKEANGFFRMCHLLRDKGGDLLGLGLADFPQTQGLMRAILLGIRTEVRGDVRQIFINSGTLHLFALSGLHVGIIALLLIGLLKSVGVTRPYWGLFLIPVLLLYVVVTGLRSSALRAFIMASVYWGGPLIRRRPDAPLALALAALVVLGLDPVQVFDPGFVLSFAVVGLLILGCGRFKEWLLSEDYQLAGRSFGRNLAFYGRSLLLSSSVAWAASFPLALFYFHRASLVGPFANLLAVPLAFVIVLTGGMTMVVGAVCPLAAELFNHANRLFLAGLCALTEWFSSVPFARLEVKSMQVWQVLFWYVGLAFLLAVKTKSHRVLGAILLLLFIGGFWVSG